MANLILNRFHQPYHLFQVGLEKNKSIYLYPNDEKSRLEISSLKKSSLCEVFKKAHAYLQKDVQAADTALEVQRQIKYLGYLLKDGQELIQHYKKKSNTWCRRLLKLINAYAPRSLKHYFPRLFTNKVQEAEQNTYTAYHNYSNLIVQLQNQLKKTKLAPKKEVTLPLVPKSIHCLPGDILQKVLQEGLLIKERADALRVCKTWKDQLTKAANRDNKTIRKYIESLIASLNGEPFKPVIEKLNAILQAQEIKKSALTILDRQKIVQKNIYDILGEYRELLNNHVEIVKTTVS